MYDLFSDLEYYAFCIFDFSPDVIDIREHFRLDQNNTLRISHDIGICHPKDPRTHINDVMTTDFVLTLEANGEISTIVRAVNYFKDLKIDKVSEKLEIERRYWAEQNVDWNIITEKQINHTLVSNIDKVRSSYHIERNDLLLDMSKTNLTKIKNELESLLIGNVKIKEVCKIFDDKHGLEPGSALILTKHLIATRRICFDMQNRMLEFDKILNIYNNTALGGTLRLF